MRSALLRQPGSGAVRRLARRLGFDDKIAIHPRQVPVIHEVFSVSAQEIARAHRLLEALREAEARGSGAVQGRDGTMVDYANVRQAEWILTLARARPTVP